MFFSILSLAGVILLVMVLLLMHCFCKKYLRKVPIAKQVLLKNDINIEPPTALPAILNSPSIDLENNEFQKSKTEHTINEQSS